MYAPADTTLTWQTLRSLNPGPRLIVTGAVHGVETCGTQAIRRLQAEIADGQHPLQRGQLTLLPVCNPLAFRMGRREGEGDLNRKIRLHDSPANFEEHVANALCPLLLAHEVLLDLHSFQSPGQPFVVIGPAAPFIKSHEEVEFAKHLGVNHFVEGVPILTTLPVPPEGGASTAIFMRANGRYGVTLECGQHADPAAPKVAYRAILNALAYFRMLAAPVPAPVSKPVSVRYGRKIVRRGEADRFSRAWQSFDAVKAGELIGTFGGGEELRADNDACLLFPDPLAKPGTEWVYFADAGTRFQLPS
ncbi:MAG: succinylglutamate desuccinylase/aspartoacylase family protein [Betaproteobacteria bacterium]|nr:succinylglutamate desuccinylase/aspartoacylase family protein [Betaproteobacteria bacterium]